MKATCFSDKLYFPMMLANGSDAVLANFTGGMNTGASGHGHLEQYQGCSPGWYKVGQVRPKWKYRKLQPILWTGYKIIVDGEAWDVNDYVQQFDPVAAVLHTRVTAGGVVCDVESFMADDHLLVEHYRIIKTPKGTSVQVGFVVHKAYSGMACVVLPQDGRFSAETTDNGEVAVTYGANKFNGVGRMLSDRPADKVTDYLEGKEMFFGASRGFSVTKFLTLTDGSDGKDYVEQMERTVSRCRSQGYVGVKRDHTKRWKTFSQQSRVSVGDDDFQYLYDLSVYCLRANQHQTLGGITVGMLPHLWCGGTHVAYDAFFAHQALLRTNHIDEGQLHLDFYRDQRSVGRRAAKSAGVPGAVYSGWSNCRGEHLSTTALKDYALKIKPTMSAIIVLEHYWQWKFDPSYVVTQADLAQCREVLDLAIDIILEMKGDIAISKQCRASNESPIDVENDTFNSLIYAKAMGTFAEMAEAMGADDADTYREWSEKLYKGLESNYRDGMLLPFRDAVYLSGMQLCYFVYNLPDGIDPRSIYGIIEKISTPWGLNTDQPSQAYRDWPWGSARAAIAMVQMGNSVEAFKWLTHSLRYTSSLGAIPETVRLDGYPIGYWYSSPHALLVWATTAAMAHDGVDDELRLLWGLDGTWQDVAFEKIRLADGLLVSAKIVKGKIVKLKLRNTSAKAIERAIVVNPKYRRFADKTITIPAGKTVSLG